MVWASLYDPEGESRNECAGWVSGTSLSLACPVCSEVAWDAALVLAAAPELARLTSRCETILATAQSREL